MKKSAQEFIECVTFMQKIGVTKNTLLKVWKGTRGGEVPTSEGIRSAGGTQAGERLQFRPFYSLFLLHLVIVLPVRNKVIARAILNHSKIPCKHATACLGGGRTRSPRGENRHVLGPGGAGVGIRLLGPPPVLGSHVRNAIKAVRIWG